MSSSNPPSGHVKLARKLFDAEHGDALWLEPRKFSRWEAWVDLIRLAAFADRSVPTKYGPVPLRRGEVITAVRVLADRWQWRKDRVTAFLDYLVADGRLTPAMLERDASSPTEPDAKRDAKAGRFGTVYLVANYDTYQRGGDESGTHRRDAKRDAKRDASGDKKEASNTRVVNPYMAEFDAMIWPHYPSRAGSNPRKAAADAYSARRGEGVSFDALADGLGRYIGYCEAKGWENTEFVMQAKRFFGPGREYENSWEVGQPKGGEKSALQELEELGAQDSWWTEGLEAARRKRAA